MKFFFTLLFVLASGEPDSRTCPKVAFEEKCPQGCYFEDNTLYSDWDKAGTCLSCPVGTFSADAGSTECQVCPPATYANLPKSVFCSSCDPKYYDGDSANSIQVWDGLVYCSLDIMAQPLASSETAAAEAPSAEIVKTDSALTRTATNGPSVNGDDVDEDGMCFPTEYKWHGSCTSCPSTVRTILHPVLIGLVVVAVIGVLSLLPERSGVWVGVEYLQLVYFLGLVSELHPVQAHVHRWILSLFALDVDAGFAWQCLIGLSPSEDQLIIVLLPLVVAASICLVSLLLPAISAGRWIVAGFHLGHMKLVLTTTEALHCGGSDWFCFESLVSSAAGIIGITIYVLAGPVWIVWQRFSYSQDGRSHDLGFRKCWWWPGFWMVRRTILASLLQALSDRPSWVLIIFLVLLMTTELLQRFALPTFKDSENQANQWFRVGTVDAVLQASLISLAGLEFISLALQTEAMRADGLTIAMLFLAILLLTFGYWLAMLASDYLLVRQQQSYLQAVGSHADEDKSQTSTSTTSSRRRSLKNGKTVSSPLPPPTSIAGSDDFVRSGEMTFPRSNSQGPLPLPLPLPVAGDDTEIEPTAEEVDGFSEWAGISKNVETKSHNRNYLLPSLPSEYSGTPLSYDVDDTSTLTGSNSYTRRNDMPSKGYVYRYDPDTISTVESSILESSEDGAPIIFADEEDSPLEYHLSLHRHRQQDEEEDHDELSEIWIDEETGRPVTNKESGEWADATTGLPVRP